MGTFGGLTMLIFLAIAAMFFIILVGGFLFGHDHDHDHDHDHGMDHGDHASEHTVSIFSMKVIATVGMGFGAGGAIAINLGCGYFAASGCGVGVGLVLGTIMWFFMNLISKQQSSSVVKDSSYVGMTGVVAIGIDPGGTGEISLSTNTGFVQLLAQADSEVNEEISKGSSVTVTRVEGGTAFVVKK